MAGDVATELLQNGTLYIPAAVQITNGTHEEIVPYSQRLETYIVPVVFALIFVIGVLGNGTLVVIFLRHKTMRNVPNTYILSLALGDLLVIVTTVPFVSVVYISDTWPFGEMVCKLSETAKDVSIGVSVFTLTALSADRFFAIVDPLRKLHATGGSRRATRMTITIAALIWILAGSCAAPAFVASHLMPMPNSTEGLVVCYPFPFDWGHRYAQAMVLTKALVLYAVPLSIIGVFYALMARHLMLSTKNVPGEMQGTQRQIRARKKVAVTVLTFVIVFAICFLPQHVFMLWFYFNPNAEDDYNAFWHVFRIFGHCLTFLNSCVNPVALYCVSGTFRKHFSRYLLCRGSQPARSRCQTCHGPRGTMSLSLTTSRRHHHSGCGRRAHGLSTVRRPVGQETSVTLVGNGNDNACSKM